MQEKPGLDAESRNQGQAEAIKNGGSDNAATGQEGRIKKEAYQRANIDVREETTQRDREEKIKAKQTFLRDKKRRKRRG